MQLQKLVTEHSAKRRDGIWSRSLKKWGWVLREKEVEGLVTQLEVHKATLGITLLMATQLVFHIPQIFSRFGMLTVGFQ